MGENKVSNSILAFVAGIGVGALVGILFAPKSGEETRDYLIGGARDAVGSVAETGQRITQNARRAVTDTTEQIRYAVNDRADQVRQVVNDRADQVRQAVSDRAEQVKHAVNETANQVRQVVDDAADQLQNAAKEGERAYTKARSA